MAVARASTVVHRGGTGRAVEPVVSVVIPTRNRPANLARTLEALGRQTRPAHEIVIVDASDQPLEEPALRGSNRALPPLVCLHTRPGLCAQRNIGIRKATGSHVLLCDDDIELPPEYIARLVAYLATNPNEGAVTGLIREADGAGGFTHGFARPSVRHLAFAFLFQLTVWADVEAAQTGWLGAPPLRALGRWYRRRGNTWTVAGWPLVTQVSDAVLHTATYGLGAALVRRSWLLGSPYDERLGAHGIGDNYGVALGFPGECPIAVLVDLPVLHHRAAANRLDPADAFLQRVLALDYFLRTSGRFSRTSVAWLIWSLVGRSMMFAARGRTDMLRSSVVAFATVLVGSNPLMARARDPVGTSPVAQASPHATASRGDPEVGR
ncbi:MAG: glycosyltransferase [Gemmatimonas sp.]|nr:glycosyltransferase [Gemmatimonas sp.]